MANLIIDGEPITSNTIIKMERIDANNIGIFAKNGEAGTYSEVFRFSLSGISRVPGVPADLDFTLNAEQRIELIA